MVRRQDTGTQTPPVYGRHTCRGVRRPALAPSWRQNSFCANVTKTYREGCLAFCESDFVVIPSGILFHYICGKPVFLCNPAHPHDSTRTITLCTTPRKMDDNNSENMYVRTHFGSDYGAAPKMDFKIGQNMTVIAPYFACERRLGDEATGLDNPELDICTTQTNLHIMATANGFFSKDEDSM